MKGNQNYSAKKFREYVDQIELKEKDSEVERMQKDVENDLYGDFNANDFRNYFDSFETIIYGSDKDLRNRIDRVKEAVKERKELKESEDFQINKDDDVIKSDSFEVVDDAFKETRSALSVALTMLEASVKTNEKLGPMVHWEAIFKRQLENQFEENFDVEQVESSLSEIEKQLEFVRDEIGSVEDSTVEVKKDMRQDIDQLKQKLEVIKFQLSSEDSEKKENGEDKEADKEKCPHCGDKFNAQGLGPHKAKCPENPENNEDS